MNLRRIARVVGRGAALVLVSSVLAGTGAPAPARADTAVPTALQEGTFWRLQARAPVVDLPCPPPQAPQQCGPVSPGAQSAPNVPDGVMVVAHAGGPTGADKGDLMWAAMEFDVLDAGEGATVEEFKLTLTQSANARGDFSMRNPPPLKACNIVAPFGSSEGTNPWDDRPAIDCSSAKAATLPPSGALIFTFDLTDFAQSWVDGAGYGVAIVPGAPGAPGPLNSPNNQYDIPPFQQSFATSNAVDAAGRPSPARPRATFRYTPEESFDDALGGDDEFGFGGDEFGDAFAAGEEEAGLFADDEFGDAGFGDDLGGGEEIGGGADGGEGGDAGDDGRPRTFSRAGIQRPAPDGLPWYLLLLIPLAGLAFLGTGTALGEAGDPVLPRTGGVSRVLATRRRT